MVYGINGDNLVETEMHCIKLLGDKLSTRNFDSQINEINARIAVLNKFTELDWTVPGLSETFLFKLGQLT